MPSRILWKLSVAAMLAAPCLAAAQSRSDSQIKSDVESKLRSDDNLSNVTVGVGVSNGVVTLTGNVSSEAQLTEAENEISSIQGISQIQDNLQISNAAYTGTAPADAQHEAGMPAQDNSGDQQQAANQGEANPPQDNGTDGPAQPNQGYSNRPGGSNGQYSNNNGQYSSNQPPPPPNYPGGNNSPNGNYGPGGPPPNGPYGNNNPYGNNQYGAAQYRNVRPMRFAAAGTAVTLPLGTVINVRSTQNVVAGEIANGTMVQGIVATNVIGADGIVIPRGAAATFQVKDSKKAGHFKGGAVLTLQMSNLTLGGQSYAVPSDVWGEQSYGKGGQTAGNTVGGAAFGALLGAIAGGGPGAAIGAGAGAAVGAGSSGLTPRTQAYVPAEGIVSFRLTAPLTVTTVTPEQAKALAAAAPPLQRPNGARPPGYGPYGRPYVYGPYYGPY